MNKKSLFSLVELLIVVAILIVLMSLLQPALRRAIDIAEITVCLNKQRNIGLAFMLFTDDHSGILPATSYGPGGRNGQTSAPNWQQNFYGSTHLKGEDHRRTHQRHHHPGVEGPIWNYLEVKSYKEIFRCPSTEKSPTISPNNVYYNNLGYDPGSTHSNGVFDFAGIEAFGGARLNQVPTTAYVYDPATINYIAKSATDVSYMESTPTPLLVEEDPEFSINSGMWSEIAHGTADELGVWHADRTSVYTAVDGSAHAIQFTLRGSKAFEWRVEHPEWGMIQMTGKMEYNDWGTREQRGVR